MKQKLTGISNPFLVATTQAAAQVVAPPQPGAKPKGIVFRVSPADWRKLKEFALASDASIQELLERGLNQQLRAAGLEPLAGQPRPRGK